MWRAVGSFQMVAGSCKWRRIEASSSVVHVFDRSSVICWVGLATTGRFTTRRTGEVESETGTGEGTGVGEWTGAETGEGVEVETGEEAGEGATGEGAAGEADEQVRAL